MADCDTFVFSLPEITCVADLRTWGEQADAAIQAAIDHVIACIQDFEIPDLDICVSKDDLVECPIDCDMINFAGVTYAGEGGVCQLPLPPNLGDYEFRTGTGLITPPYGDAWSSTAIVFDTPFTSECLCVNPVVTRVYGCIPEGCGPSGVDVEGNDYAIIVQESSITSAGATVWIYREHFGCDCNVFFRYFAIGR